MHQGRKESNSGDYIQDPSAIEAQDVAGHRIVSGHYHARQCYPDENGGIWDFIGSPYTVTFGEANDPDKGFQILYSDGSLEFVPTNLRRHRIVDFHIDDIGSIFHMTGDLIWVKIRGPADKLVRITKEQVKHDCELSESFRLELVHDEQTTQTPEQNLVQNLSQTQIFDSLIESLSNTTPEQKQRVRHLWKLLVDNKGA